jgi:hypothetical protein
MELAEDIDIWEIADRVVICPRDGLAAADIAAKLNAPDRPGQTASEWLATWFARAFVGTNVEWRETPTGSEWDPDAAPNREAFLEWLRTGADTPTRPPASSEHSQ